MREYRKHHMRCRMIKVGLKDIMYERGLNIQDVHEITGISRNSISNMINNEMISIRFDTLEKLMLGLDVGLDELLIVK